MSENGLIRVASFNLKRDFGIPLHRSHKWQERRALAAQFIRESGAAIIGVQELLPSMREDICRLLDTDYAIQGLGRFCGRNPKEDEHSDILVKKQDATIRQVQTFWLSKHPERLSRAYYALFPRICTMAEIHLEKSGREIRVFNTHLDHICGFARELGIQVILDYMQRYQQQNPMPTVLMGDFNCKPNSRPIKLLRGRLRNAYAHLSPDLLCNTLHNFSGRVRRGAFAIDYIFVSDEFEVVESQVITDSIDGHYPSDHYPLLVTLKLHPIGE